MKPFKRHDIRTFLTGWILVMLIAFFAMAAGVLISVSRMHQMAARLYSDSRTLQASQDLEQEISDARFETAARASHLQQAKTYFATLRASVSSDDEAVLLRDVETQFSRFSKQLSQSREYSRGASLPDDGTATLLATIQKHRALNRRQMDATLQRSNALDSAITFWSGVLVAAGTLLLCTGGIALWRRTFRPMLGLSRAAQQIGAGKTEARAPILRDDEMGQLSRTFNTMADSLAQRDRERFHFVATVAHDLRNPLVIIGGAAHLLNSRGERLDAAQRRQWLENIVMQSRRMDDTITDMTDAVQIQNGQLRLNKTHCDLRTIAELCVAECRDSSERHIFIFHGAQPCPIDGDARRLSRAIANLLSNAVKYSPEGGEIVVSVEPRIHEKKPYVQLCVRDCGVGIAPDEVKDLFQPFSRVERTQHVARGTGLGLVSVKNIIEEHGGEISIDGAAGEGTTITFVVPLRET